MQLVTILIFCLLTRWKGVGMQICKTGGDEETEDVVVDGDDTATFGPTQFSENDIQSAAADHSSHEEGNNFEWPTRVV